MKILHYSLGFPPYRTGGLTKYCIDLMLTQIENGNDVSLLWPGHMNIFNKSISIKTSINHPTSIISHELINPLPVPLDEGVRAIQNFMTEGDKDYYKHWLQAQMPAIIHIHTLMGLHKEFLLAAKECKIQLIYSSHDFYGLCPKVTLFKNGMNCIEDHDCQDCVMCNSNALSIPKIRLIQSRYYRFMKNTYLIKFIRKYHRNKHFNQRPIEIIRKRGEKFTSILEGRDYENLRNYYLDIFSFIDKFHFNSNLTATIFHKYFVPSKEYIINITHRNISDNRKILKTEKEIKKIVFLGSINPLKGFNQLKKAMDELWNDGMRDFRLYIFTTLKNSSPYIIKNKKYNYNDLKKILSNADLVVTPSVGYETFGFTVLEALSYGVPVLVSNHVGAQDIIENAGVVVNANDYLSLKHTLHRLIIDEDLLLSMKKSCKNIIITNINQHQKEIMNMYLDNKEKNNSTYKVESYNQ